MYAAFLKLRMALRLFALAIVTGGGLVYLSPGSFQWLFGLASGGTSSLAWSLAGLGVMTGGWLIFRWLKFFRTAYTGIAVAEAFMVAGIGALCLFIVNFNQGYAPGMTFLTICMSMTAAVGIGIRYYLY